MAIYCFNKHGTKIGRSTQMLLTINLSCATFEQFHRLPLVSLSGCSSNNWMLPLIWIEYFCPATLECTYMAAIGPIFQLQIKQKFIRLMMKFNKLQKKWFFSPDLALFGLFSDCFLPITYWYPPWCSVFSSKWCKNMFFIEKTRWAATIWIKDCLSFGCNKYDELKFNLYSKFIELGYNSINIYLLLTSVCVYFIKWITEITIFSQWVYRTNA